MKSQVLHTVWGCRGNLKFITLGSERVNRWWYFTLNTLRRWWYHVHKTDSSPTINFCAKSLSLSQSKALAKRMQHFGTTSCNIAVLLHDVGLKLDFCVKRSPNGRNMLRATMLRQHTTFACSLLHKVATPCKVSYNGTPLNKALSSLFCDGISWFSNLNAVVNT